MASGLLVGYERVVELWDIEKREVIQSWSFDHRYNLDDKVLTGLKN